ncbi:MAG: cupredoxin domain-containing protein [Gloeomargarita sp. HHBFW_bins_162]
MKFWFRSVITLVLMAWIWSSSSGSALAKDVFFGTPPVEAHVNLGNSANALVFEPENLEFVAGKRYRLVLENPSSLKHYFTAKDFADGIWTQKIEAGNVEVKGAIHEVELKPGAFAEWFFVPIKSGTYELHCSIPGHAEAGMVGTVKIVTPKQAA